MPTQKLTYKTAATLSADRAFAALASSPRGLSSDEAAARLARTGSNEVRHDERKAWDILLRQIVSPFIWLLAAAAGISWITGDHQEAAMIFAFIAVNTGLGFTQEFRAERASRVLGKYWEDVVHVVRDGKIVEAPSRELVSGDVIKLQAGDKIPADMRFVHTRGLLVDESSLTGESVNVAKDSRSMRREPGEYYQAVNVGFSGTAVLAGEADGLVFATGALAALGNIAELTAEARPESAFESEIGRFSAFILKLVVVTLSIVFALNLGLKGLGRFQELLIFTIALTVGVIPEALPVITTMALSTGAVRLAKRKVVVKRLSAINDLGSIDVLCTDKTGTITQNVLQVARVRASDAEACVHAALLASSFLGETRPQSNNAFDTALWRHASVPARAEAQTAAKLGELPFDPTRRRNAVLVRARGHKPVLVVRGAPEDVLSLCRDVPEPVQLGRYLAREGLAGNRVLAVAVRRDLSADADLTQAEKGGLVFLGVISFRDPLKQDAVAAAARAKQLGVQIKILTGDAREVAGAVARRLGIINDESETVTGAEFDALSSAERHAAVQKFHVFARLNPAQKFNILGLLKERSTVGFLGEGFNDAPGLKIAHVAIAVSGASDIAREAADVILLEQSLMVICDGIAEGRRIFANVIKYVRTILSSNFGNFYSVAAASLFITYLPMLPVQILLVNLLSDLPNLAISTDRVDAKDLRRPKHYDARDIIVTALTLGVVSSVFDFVIFALFQPLGEAHLQTLWFVESILTELVLIFSLRTSMPFFRSRPSWPLGVIAAAVAVLTIAFPFLPFGQHFFHFAQPTLPQILTVLGIVAAYFIATEATKLYLVRTRRNVKTA